MRGYTYTVLKYVHDPVAGECINVGVALFSPEFRFLGAKCRHKYSRLSNVYPDLNGIEFRRSMIQLERAINNLGKEVQSGDLFKLSKSDNVMEYALRVLSKDDSSLQWSPLGNGISDNPELELEKLFDRLVLKYDRDHAETGKSDQDVWQTFSKALERRNLLGRFETKVVEVEGDEIEFQHAYKNGAWHCLEALSFDLISETNIKGKAHRVLGELTSIQDTKDDLRIYLLLGRPSREDLQASFEKGISILNKIPLEKEILVEDDAEKLAELFASRTGK